MSAEIHHAPRARMLAAQIGYQNRLLARTPMIAFSTLGLPVMVLLAVIMLHGAETLRTRGGIDFDQFFVPAMMAFAVMVAGYVNVLTGVAAARDHGVLKRMRGTPLPPILYFGGRLVTAELVAVVTCAALAVAGALVYDVTFPWAAAGTVLLTIVVGLACFAALGLAGGFLVRSAQSAMAIAWGTLLPLLFISDVFVPMDEAPAWLRQVADVFPARHLAHALEYAFNPRTGSAAVQWDDLAVMAAWGVVALGVALIAERRRT